ncbi:MAG: tetratricopeptide repeat protein [Planctomycetota bacterium]|jgi:tetratricopeptide (TPR) repeat protein
MNALHEKEGKRKRKSWRFWLIVVVTPIMVTVCSSIAVYGLYVKKGVSGKQGFEKGLIYAKLHRNKDAIDVFRKELAKNPDDANIHYHMGISYFKLREYDRAIAKLEDALKIRPDFSDARHQLTAIYLTKALELRRLGKKESLVLEKLIEVEEMCRSIIASDPNYINAYTRLGEIHISMGLIDDAIIDYKDALKLDNSLIDAHVAIIRLYMQADKIDLAEKQCDVVLSEIDPDSYEVQIFLSAIYEQQDELGKAAGCIFRG